jgi:phosphoglycerate kinase
MYCIDTLERESLYGKRVIVRAGFDVPLNEHGTVADLFRIRRGVPTLAHLRACGAKTVILSHLGRKPEETNAPVARALASSLPITYVPDLLGPIARAAVDAMQPGDIILLENLRSDARETANDPGFAREIAVYGELCVEDAFSAAHRAHASIATLPTLMPAYAGILLRDEVAALDAARTPPEPSLAILGGAKFETKEPLIRALLETHSHVFVTGALGNDILKTRGYPVGTSLLSDTPPAPDVLAHPRLLAPVDVTVERPDGHARTKMPHDVTDDERIVDIGPETLAMLSPHVVGARAILWNGPTGIYEHGYVHWTHAIAELVAQSRAEKVIGGGDTIAAILGSGVAEDSLGFLSTGGGAMLEYLLEGTLPGIAVLS